MCLPLQGVELIIPNGKRSTEMHATLAALICLVFGVSLLWLIIKDFTAGKHPTACVCHKHHLLGGRQKPSTSPQTLLPLNSAAPLGAARAGGSSALPESPTGHASTQAHSFPVLLALSTYFLHLAKKKHCSQISPQWWNPRGCDSPLIPKSIVPALQQQSHLPHRSALAHRALLLDAAPTCNSVFPHSHTHLSIFIRGKRFYINLEDWLLFSKCLR